MGVCLGDGKIGRKMKEKFEVRKIDSWREVMLLHESHIGNAKNLRG